MSSSREKDRIADIVGNVDAIERYTSGMSFHDFAADEKTIDACERCLTRISEAAIKIGEVRMLHVAPSLPVHVARAVGNALRHEYDRIDIRAIFNTIENDLPLLRSECQAELNRLAGDSE